MPRLLWIFLLSIVDIFRLIAGCVVYVAAVSDKGSQSTLSHYMVGRLVLWMLCF